MINLSEKHNQASAGDFRAMLDLADYYYELYEAGDQNSLQTSILWLDRAAEAGSVAGVMQSITGYELLAVTREISDNWPEARAAWKAQNKWANVAREHIKLDAEEQAMVYSALDASLYNIAFCYYTEKDYAGAKNTLKNWNCTKSMILQGACTFSEAMSNLSLLPLAYNQLGSIERDLQYAHSKKTSHEEEVFSDASCYLSIIYRLGIDNFVRPNLDKAVSVLVNALNVSTEGAPRNLVQIELDKYKKKLFGGYTYTG